MWGGGDTEGIYNKQLYLRYVKCTTLNDGLFCIFIFKLKRYLYYIVLYTVPQPRTITSVAKIQLVKRMLLKAIFNIINHITALG